MATNFLINGSEFSDNFIPKDAFTSGGLWSWGNNTFGQLGDGTQSSRSSPAQITGNNWKEIRGGSGGPVVSVIKTDGTLWQWGALSYGLTRGAGVSGGPDASSPIQVAGTTWKQVATGLSHGGFIKSDGTLWVLGDGGLGKNGDNTTTGTSSPIQTIAGGTNWKMVSCGYYHKAAIKTDGTLWAWGGNTQGQLGDGTTSNRSSPVQIAGTTWKQISCGDRFMAAVKTDGTLWTWGNNYQGTLGLGFSGGTNDYSSGRSSPSQVSGTTWKMVSCGTYSASAIKTDGSLWSWGTNDYGQIGDGTTSPKSSPVQTVAGGNNWKIVFNGHGRVMAGIKTDGTLWTWGGNSTGGLGDGTTTNRSSPVQTVAGGTNWKNVMSCGWAGYGYMIGIRDDS